MSLIIISMTGGGRSIVRQDHLVCIDSSVMSPKNCQKKYLDDHGKNKLLDPEMMC
jgi:hypothetical protein